MKTNLFLIAILWSVAFGAQAQEFSAFANFDELVLRGNLDVVLTPGEKTGVYVESGEEKNIKIEKQGNELKVRHAEMYRYKSYKDFPIKVEIIYNDLDMITASAGVKVKSNGSVEGARVDVRLRSGARAELDIQADKSDVNVGEGAAARLTGNVMQFTGLAATGGKLEAGDLYTKRCKIRANTGGSASVLAKEYLDAAAHTGGKISYQGSPTELVIEDDLGGNIYNGGK